MKKKKITISLSERTLAVMEALRERTDADTDSEVFRNALRLHLVLLRAQAAGVRLFMKDAANAEALIPVDLFVSETKE